MYQHETEIRVRYGETDQMGFVYYGNYPLYYEVGRVEALRNLGLSYKEMEADGIALPVRKLEINYYKPALYDHLLRMETKIEEFQGARLAKKIFQHAIRDYETKIKPNLKSNRGLIL